VVSLWRGLMQFAMNKSKVAFSCFTELIVLMRLDHVMLEDNVTPRYFRFTAGEWMAVNGDVDCGYIL